MPTSPADTDPIRPRSALGPTPATVSPTRRPGSRLLASRPSADLARAAQGGDADAAGELFRRAHGRARRAAWRFCPEADVDDAVAEGLARALARIGQLQDPAAVEAWMIRCVVRSASDLARGRMRLRPTGDVEDLAERAVPPGESASDAAMSALDCDAMAAAWCSLHPRFRLLLHLRYQSGLSVADIAMALGRPVGTVRRQCLEARRVAGQRFLGHHLLPANGACATVSDWLCQVADGRSATRSARQALEHLPKCRACRERQQEVAAILDEFGFRPPRKAAAATACTNGP